MKVENLLIQFVAISLCVLQATAQGISCYRCVVAYSGYDASEQLCSQFDGSEKFQVYCPSSLFCTKKTIYYKSQTSVIKTVQRDCANQKYVYRTYDINDKQWHDKEEVIKEVYEEGCVTGENRGATARPPEYCYCSFHLCNSTVSNKKVNVIIVSLLTLPSLYGKLYFYQS
ncbi:hypothetical protein KPH14_005232 [Odynerus spinipes]|uniref:Protein sleepless n=1 Tax=Odynerus spinipes TaxID=1348599 RepID=A0AAD9VJ60_9HYME|nr:hypothetical protein KPH14_005232 [Odynerus spinipes]